MGRALKKCKVYGRTFFMIYTLFFVLVSSIIALSFYFEGKTMIYSGDAYIQGFPGIVKELNYLKKIVYDILVNHQLQIPLIDFSIGFGMDTIINMFHFPIVILGLFCPEKYYVLFYQMIPFALLYIAGICYMVFCYKIHIKNRYAVLMGCLSYLCGGYTLFSLTRYISFMSPLIYLPLCLSGIEDVIQKKKTKLLIFSIAFLFIENWYFGYIISVFVVIYCVVRLFPMIKKKCFLLFLKTGVQLAGVYLLGIMLSCAFLLPAIHGYFYSCRSSSNNKNIDSFWHYNLSYYKQFFSGFIVPGVDSFYEMFVGYLPVVLIALVMLFIYANKRRYRIWKCMCIILFICAMFPLFGRLFNGGGYVSNRWCVCLSFTLSITVALALSMLDELQERQIDVLVLVTLGLMTIYFIIAFCNRVSGIWVSVCVLFVYANIFMFYKRSMLSSKLKQGVLLCATLFSVMLFIITNFHISLSDYVQSFMGCDETMDGGYLSRAEDIEDNGFYRIGSPWNETHYSMYHEYNGSSIYSSLLDSNTSDFFKELSLNTQRYPFQLTGLDGRAVLNDLFAVKYYISNTDSVPYGFMNINKNDIGTVSLSDHTVRPVRLYDTYMLKDDYMELQPLQRQDALNQTVVLEEKLKSLKEVQYKDNYVKLPYQITRADNIELKENLVQVNNADARLTFTFELAENTETYLYIKGCRLLSDENMATIYTNAEGIMNRFLIINENYQYYVDDTITVNLGYSEKGLGTCTLAFSGPCQFSYDSIEMISYPMEKFEQCRNRNDEQDQYTFKIKNNQFICELKADDEKLVQFSIPYSSGWRAFVDGEPVDIYKSDTMFMSILVEKGSHDVLFVYCTPLLKQGIAISMIAVLAMFYLWLRNRKIIDHS